ncbi:hypothetical protein Vadar_017421 [Vaccinium darrowii]|uniref:Uncharacterized protein n=1 Tax=Vaccinium darrowii TaxID=229202 RepID=A0ACB7XAJ5_9ERIC|nr:hypothetical protein Vadar_017421 [Vaccinium darrowii]
MKFSAASRPFWTPTPSDRFSPSFSLCRFSSKPCSNFNINFLHLSLKFSLSLSLSLSLSHTPGFCCGVLAVSRIKNDSYPSGGSQRERDRERAQARSGHKPRNPKDDGLTPEQRRERDAKALQEKMARKAAAQGGTGGNKNSSSDVNKNKK